MLRASLQTPRGRSQYLWAGPTDFAGRSQQLWAGPPDLTGRLVGRPTGKSPDRPDGHPASASNGPIPPDALRPITAAARLGRGHRSR